MYALVVITGYRDQHSRKRRWDQVDRAALTSCLSIELRRSEDNLKQRSLGRIMFPICRLFNKPQVIFLQETNKPFRYQPFDYFGDESEVGDRPVVFHNCCIKIWFLYEWHADGMTLRCWQMSLEQRDICQSSLGSQRASGTLPLSMLLDPGFSWYYGSTSPTVCNFVG